MSDVAAATVVAKKYLSYARVLADSFRRQHTDVPFFVLLADEVEGYFDLEAETFLPLRLEDLRIPDLQRFRFQHAQQELSYAATPYLLKHLLDRGFKRAAFVKQESLVTGDLTPILDLISRHSIVLTPHLLEPLTGEEGITRELEVLRAGVYNVGFLGVSDTETARAFLRWWQDRVYANCRYDMREGLHYEQRWLDLVPTYFEDVHVVRAPGFNIGHWNLPERNVSLGAEGAALEWRSCPFFRFSGFDPDRPEAVTRYTSRLNLSNVGPVAELFRQYRLLLEEAGYHETKRWPYAYDYYSNGEPVTEAARRAYRELGDDARRFGDPLDTTRDSNFFHWHKRQADVSRGIRKAAARLWHAVLGGEGDVPVN